jgi:hypothetical protein
LGKTNSSARACLLGFLLSLFRPHRGCSGFIAL